MYGVGAGIEWNALFNWFWVTFQMWMVELLHTLDSKLISKVISENHCMLAMVIKNQNHSS